MEYHFYFLISCERPLSRTILNFQIHMDSIISTFHIDWKIIVAQAVNFGVVFVVLYIFALKPLSKLMAERTEKIEKGITDARTSETMLKETNLKYEEMLAKARIEGDTIFQVGKKEGEAEKAKMIEKGKLELVEILESGKKALKADKVKIVAEANREITSLAMVALEKLLSDKNDLKN